MTHRALYVSPYATRSLRRGGSPIGSTDAVVRVRRSGYSYLPYVAVVLGFLIGVIRHVVK